MLRRSFLLTAWHSALLLPFAALAWPRQALAMGGVMPELGSVAPAFQLDGFAPPADPVTLSLSDFSGQWLVLYFYPRDFTSGCTLEAQSFQKELQRFRQAGAAVVGISADTTESHSSFCSEEGLAFPLLSDPKGTVSQSYGSWIAPFSQRHTFLIGPDGVIRARWQAVRPLNHGREVLDELLNLKKDS